MIKSYSRKEIICEIVNEINEACEAGLCWTALTSALLLPDLCSQNRNIGVGQRYKEWKRFFEFEISASFFCSILCYAAIEAVKDYADKDIFTEQSVKIIDNRHNPDLLLPPFSDSQL